MKRIFIFFIATLLLFSCNKESFNEVTRTIPILVDESEVLKPAEGYSKVKRSKDFLASQSKGKPVKNTIGNVTDLMTTVRSPYQIDLNFTGIKNAVSYNVYRDNVFIKNTIQPFTSDFGLIPGTKYKYQVAGVTSTGIIGNLSNVVYGTTFYADLGTKVLVYLSFNGDTTLDPGWIPYSGGLPLVTKPSGFTEEEQQAITDGIARDLQEFANIRVTRNRAEYLAADPARRIKTVFTESFEWYSGPTPTAGGVSYKNVLGLDRTNFVFSSALYYNVYYNIVAGTHELGHGIGGLNHAVDCCDCGQSYGGDGNHMGSAYHQQVRFWSVEHLVPGCRTERQIEVMKSRTQ